MINTAMIITGPARNEAGSFIHKLAIIPAKGHSERCPDKNLRLLGGQPLFLHSVSYARQEGFIPVVSTDSEAVMERCRLEGVRHLRETVDDRKMENCIHQVLSRISCHMFAILQPTSPFRHQGLLAQMAMAVEKEEIQAAYTAHPVKVIGHLDGHFQIAHREQDARRFLHFFDGNINVVTQKHFERTGTMFDDEARSYLNSFPCNLQIDTEEEWNAMARLAVHSDYQRFLASHGRQRRICIISNKRDLKRNYSTFVDSCDKIIRVSKMDNLDSGLTGTRTDIAVVSCFPGYAAFSPAARHMDALRKVPEIYFNNEELGYSNEFACREKLANWKFMPGAVHRSTPNFTTLSKALCLADYLFPNDHLYYLGDIRMELRAPGSPKHHAGPENAYLQALMDSGRMTAILEDESGTYSSPVASPPAAPPPPEEETEQTIVISHPQWKDQFRMGKTRGRRLHRNDHATILEHDGFKLVLKWDQWGTEEFYRTGKENYYKLDYHFTSTINEVNKYTKELIINPCDGSNSVFHRLSQPVLVPGYRQWNFLLLLERMYVDMEREIRKLPLLESILLLGICKDSLTSLAMGIRLKKDFPHLRIGVWGCPWIGDASGPSPVHQGITVSPAHAQICEKEPFRSLLKNYGNALSLMQKPDAAQLHLFAFCSSNRKWMFDKESTSRLEPYLRKTYIHEGKEDEPHTHIHGKIVQLVKQNPALVQQWITEMFHLMETPADIPPHGGKEKTCEATPQAGTLQNI